MTQQTQYEIETHCTHTASYINSATGVKRCPTCQCTRHRVGGIKGVWEWRRYNDYHIDSEYGNNARLSAIESCFD